MPDKEELKDGRSDDHSRDGEGREGKSEGVPASTDESGGKSGGVEGSGGGVEGSEGTGGGTQGRSASPPPSDRGSKVADRKQDILSRVRSKRTKGERGAASSENGADRDNHKGNKRNGGRPRNGTESNDRTVSGASSDTGRSESQSGDGDTQSSQDAQGTTRDQELKGKPKPSGLEVIGAGKFKREAPSLPKMRFTWDEKTLTKKEADELLPKFKGMLSVLFRAFDSGITISNREQAKAEIWSTIDDEDVTIIAQHFVDMAQASKVIATVVRRMSNSYRLFEINLITLPKLIQTFQFYQAHGGFMLVPGRGKH